MLLKINQKPIHVKEDTEEEKDFSPVYLGVSCVGYGLILALMDYICYIFFYFHPFPFISWLGGIVQWLL